MNRSIYFSLFLLSTTHIFHIPVRDLLSDVQLSVSPDVPQSNITFRQLCNFCHLYLRALLSIFTERKPEQGKRIVPLTQPKALPWLQAGLAILASLAYWHYLQIWAPHYASSRRIHCTLTVLFLRHYSSRKILQASGCSPPPLPEALSYACSCRMSLPLLHLLHMWGGSVAVSNPPLTPHFLLPFPAK